MNFIHCHILNFLRRSNRLLKDHVFCTFWIFGLLSMPLFAGEIEIIPVAVFQGQEITEYDLEALSKIQAQWGEKPLAYAINPVYGTGRFTGQKISILQMLAATMRPQDGVVMHLAPLDDLDPAELKFSNSMVGLFGDVHFPCISLCGLEVMAESFKPDAWYRLVSLGLERLEKLGISRPKAIIFEQGLVSDDVWQQAKRAGIDYDWSGFSIESAKTYLGRSPLYKTNVETAHQILSDSSNKSDNSGRIIDFIKYGIYADVTDELAVAGLIQSSIQSATRLDTPLRVPVFFNVSSLIHSGHKVQLILHEIASQAAAFHVDVKPWNRVESGRFDLEQIKRDAPSWQRTSPHTLLGKIDMPNAAREASQSEDDEQKMTQNQTRQALQSLVQLAPCPPRKELVPGQVDPTRDRTLSNSQNLDISDLDKNDLDKNDLDKNDLDKNNVINNEDDKPSSKTVIPSHTRTMAH
jgi:hypothetical protein